MQPNVKIIISLALQYNKSFTSVAFGSGEPSQQGTI